MNSPMHYYRFDCSNFTTEELSEAFNIIESAGWNGCYANPIAHPKVFFADIKDSFDMNEWIEKNPLLKKCTIENVTGLHQ